MERSGSQKALLVFSILEIIGAVLVLGAAIMAMLATGAVGLAGSELTSDEMAAGIAVGSILSIVLVISGVWGLLCGIFGIRAANDNQKIMIVWVFILIGLILNVVGIVLMVVNGTFMTNVASAIIGLAINVIMFVVANNIKREAGK